MSQQIWVGCSFTPPTKKKGSQSQNNQLRLRESNATENSEEKRSPVHCSIQVQTEKQEADRVEGRHCMEEEEFLKPSPFNSKERERKIQNVWWYIGGQGWWINMFLWKNLFFYNNLELVKKNIPSEHVQSTFLFLLITHHINFTHLGMRSKKKWGDSRLEEFKLQDAPWICVPEQISFSIGIPVLPQIFRNFQSKWGWRRQIRWIRNRVLFTWKRNLPVWY